MSEHLKNDNSAQKLKNKQRFIAANQASKLLNISVSSLFSKVAKGELALYRNSKQQLLISRRELGKLLVKRKVKSPDELNGELEN